MSIAVRRAVVNSAPIVHDGETRSEAALLIFFALAFGWSWTCWLLASAVQLDWPVASTALSFAGGFGPSLAAVVVIVYGGGLAGLRRWLRQRLRWRLGWRWILLAFVVPGVFMGLAAAAHVGLGGSLPPSPAATHVWLAVANVFLIFFIGGPLGEELGWRGYALPVLQTRWGWRVAGVLLGLVWAVWHLPLFYSAGTVQSHLPMALYALSAVATSVLFAWLFNRSRGSVVPVLVLHTAVNAWPMVIPVVVLPDGSNLRPFQFVVGILVLAAVALLCRGERVPKQALDSE